MSIIISLSGKKGTGKSFVANYLSSKYGFWEYAWASPIKEIIAKQLFNLTKEQLYGKEKELILKEWGYSPRQLFQIIGTNCFRNHISKDIWVKIGLKKIQEKLILPDHQDLVISDSRFPEEINAIKRLKGITILIQKINETSKDEHQSEIALDNYKFEYIIKASAGDLNSLYRQIDNIVL